MAARAIRCARDGFPVHTVMRDYIEQYQDSYLQFPGNMAIWLPEGRVPTVGSRMVQSDLADTLQHLCDQETSATGDRVQKLEAVRTAFYEGDIAQAILRHQRENDGLLTASDLKDFRCQWLPSLSRKYRFALEEVEIHACGAWSQGPAMLEALAILEHVDMAQYGFGTDKYLHAMAEALKLTLSDRKAYVADPDFVDVPVGTLMSREYGELRAREIDPAVASPGMPFPGQIKGFAPYLSPVIERSAPARLPADTSIVTVVDDHGNAVCVTPSDTSWDTPVVPGTGLAVSSRGDQSRANTSRPCVPGQSPHSCRACRQNGQGKNAQRLWMSSTVATKPAWPQPLTGTAWTMSTSTWCMRRFSGPSAAGRTKARRLNDWFR